MKIMNFFKRPWVKNVFLISVLITLIYAFLFTYTGFFQAMRLRGFDLAMRVKHRVMPAPGAANDLVVIEIDDESIRGIGEKWPWDRRVFAQLIGRVARYGPRVICFDILFIGKSPDAAADKALAGALKKGKNVILASNFDLKGRYIKPLEQLTEAATAVGFVDYLRDRDFVVRRTRPVMLSKGGRLIDFSLPLKAAAFFFGVPEKNIFYNGRSIILKREVPAGRAGGYITIPLVSGNELIMNYSADRNQVLHVPLGRVIKEELPAKLFKDKVVLIGVTSRSVPDIYPSPLGMMSGVMMNANCVLMLLGSDYIKRLPDSLNIIALFLISFLVCAVTYRVNVIKRELYCAAALAAFVALNLLLALRSCQWDLFGGILLIVSSYIIASLYKYIGLVMENIALKTAAITDPLTGLFAYRYFDLRLRNEFKKVQKEGGRLSMVIVDIDHFKALNTKYGNKAGDDVLKTVAAIIKENSRRRDVVARYGGEEIVLILIDTGLEGAYICAKKIHKAIDDFAFRTPSGEPLKVTASLGVATYPWRSVRSKAELIESADAALYRAKNTGRNRICVFEREEIS